jgi:hypothetical protein
MVFAAATIILATWSGCNSNKHQWEITVENKSDVPCSLFIELSPTGGLKVEDVKKGKNHSLIAGANKTVVETVRVVRAKDEQILNPNLELPVGKRYAVVVTADGKVETSVLDR